MSEQSPPAPSIPSSEVVSKHFFHFGPLERENDKAFNEYVQTPHKIESIALFEPITPLGTSKTLFIHPGLNVDELAMLRHYTKIVSERATRDTQVLAVQQESKLSEYERELQYGKTTKNSKRHKVGKLVLDSVGATGGYELMDVAEQIFPTYFREAHGLNGIVATAAFGLTHLAVRAITRRKTDKSILQASQQITEKVANTESGGIPFESVLLEVAIKKDTFNATLAEHISNRRATNAEFTKEESDILSKLHEMIPSGHNVFDFFGGLKITCDKDGSIHSWINPARIMKNLLTRSYEPAALWQNGLGDNAAQLSAAHISLKGALKSRDHEVEIMKLTRTEVDGKLPSLESAVEFAQARILVLAMDMARQWREHNAVVEDIARQKKTLKVMQQSVAQGYKAQDGAFNPHLDTLFAIASRSLAKMDITEADSDKVATDVGTYLNNVATEHDPSDPTEIPRLYQGLINNFGAQLPTLPAWEAIAAKDFNIV